MGTSMLDRWQRGIAQRLIQSHLLRTAAPFFARRYTQRTSRLNGVRHQPKRGLLQKFTRNNPVRPFSWTSLANWPL
jgi:hypothetical protein